MAEQETVFETTCVSSKPHKIYFFQNIVVYNEPAIVLGESQKSLQHNAQFRVLVSRTVTKAHAVAVVRARYHKTGAGIVN